MDQRVEKLIKAFEGNGWEFRGSADVSSDWWFEEIFHMSSIFSPVNTNLYLTLLADPQITKWKEVWAIAISKEIPQGRDFKFIEQITLGDIKKVDLDLLVKTVNKVILGAE